MQRALIQYRDPKNYDLVREAPAENRQAGSHRVRPEVPDPSAKDCPRKEREISFPPRTGGIRNTEAAGRREESAGRGRGAGNRSRKSRKGKEIRKQRNRSVS